MEKFFRALMQRADVLLLGDTNHRDPSIKQCVADLLPALTQEGVTSLWLEVEQKHQAAFAGFIAQHPDASVEALQQFFRDTTKLKSADAYGMLVHAALKCGLSVQFADDKTPADAVRDRFPDFAAVREQVREHTKRGGLEGREQYLSTLSPEVRVEYEEAYAQWKQARDEINPQIAQRITEQHRSAGGKALLLIGNEHMNTDKDIDEYLKDAGLHVAHVDLYHTERDAYADLRRIVAETGKATFPPEYAYLMDEEKIIRSADLLEALQADDAKHAATATPDSHISTSLLQAWRSVVQSLGIG